MIEWHCEHKIINMAFHALSQLKYWQTDCSCIAALDTHRHPIHHMWHCSQGSATTGTRWYHMTPGVLGHSFISISWSSPTSTRAAGGRDGWHDCHCCWKGSIYSKWLLSLPYLHYPRMKWPSDNPVFHLHRALSNGTDFLQPRNCSLWDVHLSTWVSNHGQ